MFGLYRKYLRPLSERERRIFNSEVEWDSSPFINNWFNAEVVKLEDIHNCTIDFSFEESKVKINLKGDDELAMQRYRIKKVLEAISKILETRAEAVGA